MSNTSVTHTTDSTTTSSATHAADQSVVQNTSMASLVVINAASQLPFKLTGTNYPTWRAQFTTLLFGYNLMGYIDGSFPCPPIAKDSAGLPVLSPEIEAWLRQDSFLRHAIMASVDPTLAPLITRATSAQDAWTKLANSYANTSKTRIYGLRNTLVRTIKENQTVGEYLRSIKSISDELAIAGSPLSDDELIITILSGLGDDYKEISAAIRARDSAITFEELMDKLIDHETYLKRIEARKDLPQITAQYTQHTRGRGRGRTSEPRRGNNSSYAGNNTSGNFYTNNNSSSQKSSQTKHSSAPRVQCQLCDKFGHVAKDCRSRSHSHIDAQAHFMSRRSSNPSPNWIVDSGASHHITSDLQNLAIHSDYDGNDGILIGDGSDNGGTTRQRQEQGQFI